MTPDDLMKIAQGAHIGDGVAWLTASDLSALSADDAAFIVTFSPDRVMAMLEVVRAARDSERAMTRAVIALAHVMQSRPVHAYGADYDAVDAALRALRSALGKVEG